MKAPAFQFYADDFIGGTVCFTAEDVGAYMRLLCFQWGNGALPAKKELVDRIAGCVVSDDVMAKFPQGINPRMEKEREKQRIYREQQSNKGKASAEARRNHGSTTVQPSRQPEVNSPSPSPSPSPISVSDSDSNSSQPEIPPTGQAPHDALRKKALRRENAKMLLDFLNETAGRSFRATDTNLDLIVARLSEPDVTPEGCEGMIERQVALWKGTETEEYLQPSTLFGKQKFGGYYDKRDLPVKLETKGNCL
jgi:uncharacterized phage protein (TIGR02220 family)